MAQFFIDRPIFAWVVGLIVMLAGALSILSLPVSQYPAIAPPTISIYATFPGSSATTRADGSPGGALTAPSCGCAGKYSSVRPGRRGSRSSG